MSQTDNMRNLVEQLLTDRVDRTNAVTALQRNTKELLGNAQTAHAAMTATMSTQLAASQAEVKAAVTQLVAETADFRNAVRIDQLAMAEKMYKTLAQSRTALANDVAAFRDHCRSDRAALAHAQAEQFAALQKELAEARSILAAETVHIREHTHRAHAAMTQTLHEKLTADRKALAAQVAQVRNDAAARMSKIRADTAGAAAAWRMVAAPAHKMHNGAAQATGEKVREVARAHLQMPEQDETEQPAPMLQEKGAPGAAGQDPLITLHGVGPTTQEKLYAAGITTFAQLAEATLEEIRSAIGPASARLTNPQEWIDQAKQLVGHYE